MSLIYPQKPAQSYLPLQPFRAEFLLYFHNLAFPIHTNLIFPLITESINPNLKFIGLISFGVIFQHEKVFGFFQFGLNLFQIQVSLTQQKRKPKHLCQKRQLLQEHLFLQNDYSTKLSI